MTAIDAAAFYDILKTRRAVRSYTDEPVSDEHLFQLARAGRFASNGGNIHPHRFLITRDPRTIRLIRSFSPGMIVTPPAIIVLMTDHQIAADVGWKLDKSYIHYVDAGTAAQNMMNMAHALGLGTCPVTSYSISGVAAVLGLPSHLTPELLLMVGHPKPENRNLRHDAPKPLTTRDLTYWETAGNHDPT